jgi:hypothetical protein
MSPGYFQAVNFSPKSFSGSRALARAFKPQISSQGENQMASVLRISASKLLTVVFVLTASLIVPSLAAAQRRNAPPQDENPVFREYRGVQIGMTADEARKKLGSPKDKGDEQDFYIFSEQETAQIVYDKTHKVSVLSVDFSSGAANVPTPKTVMGSEIEAKADGSMYKMIRYTKAGYWVSYNRTAGDTPMITITIQKID